MSEKVSIIRRADRSGLPLLAARLIVGGTFIYMGLLKALDPVAFLKNVRLYEMLPESPGIFVNAVAIVFPWLEIVCGLVLILGVYLRGAALVAAVMLSVFTPAILLRTMDLAAAGGISFFKVAFDCGCGTGVVVAWQKVLTNLGLFFLALLALLSRSRRFCPSG